MNMDSNHINDYSPNYHNLNKRFTSLELDKCVNYSKLDDNKHSEKYDSIVAIPSSDLFTKSFTNIPFLSGRMIEKCSEESYKYTMKVFKAIFDYDTAEEIFKEVPKKIIKTLFTVEISKLILVNQLVKNYFDDLIKMEAIHMMNYTLFLLRKTYGMNLTYLDLTYVANTKTNQTRISEYYATV